MKNGIKLLFLTIILLLVSLCAVSADTNMSDNSHSDITTSEDTSTNIQSSGDILTDISTKNIELDSNPKVNKIKTNNEIKEAKINHITEETYDQFFEEKSKYFDYNNTEITEEYIEENNLRRSYDYYITKYTGLTGLVNEDDILDLQGNFTTKVFGLDKKVTLTSINHNAFLKNCKVMLSDNASGTTIANLVIRNEKGAPDQTSGIAINRVNNILVENNSVITSNYGAHPFDVITNNSIIRNNYFESQDTGGRTHSAMVFCGSNYNIIANNTVVSDGANCIYLSGYPGQTGLGVGGASKYNLITGNDVTGADTGWCYTIQMMGSYNNATNNTVRGGYYGISTAGAHDVISGNDISATERGVSTSTYTLVSNNNIHVTNASVGIYISNKNDVITNNTISTEKGHGIEIYDNNVSITNNTITSTDGYGIFSQPTTTKSNGFSQVYIDNNTINSKLEGIIFLKFSLQYVNDILVTNNNITSESDYAINFKDAGAFSASGINVTVTSSNVLKSSQGTGNYAYLPPTKTTTTVDFESNQIINISSLEIYEKYFDNKGVANSNVTQNATVYISTTLDNKNLIFSKKVHIIGQNGIINNGTITLKENAHESTITDITINNKNDDIIHGIEVIEVNNCIITNNTIENYAGYESLGIFVFGSNGNKITSNNIKTSGDYINNGILLCQTTGSIIENNTINLNQTDVDSPYETKIQFNDIIGGIQEVLHNHGIILLSSSSNTINNNKVTTNSMYKAYAQPTEDRKNSVVGIDIYFQSNNNKVTNNVINVDSYGPYAYGFGVLGGPWGTNPEDINATSNIFQNNNVTVKGGYFATGFIAGRNSINTILESNNISVEARRNNTNKGDYAYGVTLENSTTSKINNNKITVNGAAGYNIELYSSGNNNITSNIINTTATNPYGIAGGESSNNQILNNTITITKSNSGTSNTIGHVDQIPLGEEAIMFMYKSTNNNIQYNTIKTNTNSTVKLTNDSPNNNVTENSLISNSKIGDQSVTNQHPSNIVTNNSPYAINATIDPINAKIGDTITIIANINTTTTDYKNLTVNFKIGTTDIGNTTVNNGKSTITYTIPSNFTSTNYTITAYITGNNFQNTTATTILNIEREAQEIQITVAKITSTIGEKVNLEANITTITGETINTGKATFYLNSNSIETVEVQNGKAVSKNQPVGNTPGIYNITVTYTDETNNYLNNQGSNNLIVQAPSTITVYDYVVGLGDEVVFKLPVVSGGRNVTSGTAHILIAGNVIGNVNVSDGLIYYKYVIPTSYDKGVLDYNVVYDGNSTTVGASATGKLTVNPFNSVIKFNSTSAVVGNQISLTVAIDNGRVGSGFLAADSGKVNIKLNNKNITGNLVNGLVEFKFDATEQIIGTHNVTIEYEGNNKFAEGSNTFTDGLIIVKSNSTITVYDYVVGLGDEVVFKLPVVSGGRNVTSGNARILVAGNVIGNVTVSNGLIYYKYVIPTSYDKGVLDYSVVYDGNEAVVGASGTGKLTVNPFNPEILFNSTSATVGSQVSLTVAINNGRSGSRFFAADGGNVAVKLNGKTLTDSNGKAITGNVVNGSIVFKFTATEQLIGTHNLTFDYVGNSKFAEGSSTFANGLIIVKSNSTITVYDYVVGLGDEVVFKLPVVSGGRNVTSGNARILVAGNVIGNVTVSNGLIYYKYVIPTSYDKGVLDYSVVYDGNDAVVGASGTGKLTVNPFNSVIKFNSTSAVVGNQVSLTVAIDNGRVGSGFLAADNGKVNIKLNNKNITGNLVNGLAEFKFDATEQIIGTHNVTIEYAGNNKFSQNSKTFINGLNITKKSTTNTTTNGTNSTGNVTTPTTNTTKPVTNTTTPTTNTTTPNTNTTKPATNTTTPTNNTNTTTPTNNTNTTKPSTNTTKPSTNTTKPSTNTTTPNTNTTKPATNTTTPTNNTNTTKPSTNTTSPIVARATIITIDAVKDVNYLGKTKITGVFKDEIGTILYNSNILASVNGKSFTVKTDSKGVYSFDAEATRAGKNFVSVYFRGNSYFKPSSNSVTFLSLNTPTIITINGVKNVAYQGKTRVTGTFKDAAGNLLFNSNVLASVNGKSFTVKTDSKGVFSFDADASLVGKNFISVYFRGNSLYKPSSNTVNFIAYDAPTVITINPISTVSYGSNVKITGTFKDVAGNILFNSNVMISVNGKSYTVKTDSKGVFTLTAKANLAGKNFVSVYFRGNTIYRATSTSLTFIANNVGTNITINKINTVKQGSNVVISGSFKDVAGNRMFNSTVTLKLNNKSYKVKTDSYGNFKYTTKDTILGTNTVQISSAANSIYKATTTTTKFSVIK